MSPLSSQFLCWITMQPGFYFLLVLYYKCTLCSYRFLGDVISHSDTGTLATSSLMHTICFHESKAPQLRTCGLHFHESLIAFPGRPNGLVVYCVKIVCFTVCLIHWYLQEHHLDDELMSLALLSSQEDKKEAAM